MYLKYKITPVALWDMHECKITCNSICRIVLNVFRHYFSCLLQPRATRLFLALKMIHILLHVKTVFITADRKKDEGLKCATQITSKILIKKHLCSSRSSNTVWNKSPKSWSSVTAITISSPYLIFGCHFPFVCLVWRDAQAHIVHFGLQVEPHWMVSCAPESAASGAWRTQALLSGGIVVHLCPKCPTPCRAWAIPPKACCLECNESHYDKTEARPPEEKRTIHRGLFESTRKYYFLLKM